ncbi:hypothetical protein ACG7TL_001884 [Trametes sanguinea]
MALNSYYKAAFQEVARQLNNITDPTYFDTIVRGTRYTIRYGEQKFVCTKLGYTRLGNYEGIGYSISTTSADGVAYDWTFWVINPSTVEVNKAALIGGIYTAINDPNAGKVAWNVDATRYATK